jgi:hypothetical protein
VERRLRDFARLIDHPVVDHGTHSNASQYGHRPAAYYLRVLEIPTPRWSTIVSVKRGEALPADVPATIQERAWSSPIWYVPGKSTQRLASIAR